MANEKNAAATLPQALQGETPIHETRDRTVGKPVTPQRSAAPKARDQPGTDTGSRPGGSEPETLTGTGRASGAPEQNFEIILKAVSHPAMGDIGIDENLFAVGRTEPPFDAYPADVVADLSRRHARIFCEKGVVHIADMGSKNGTSVNGIDVRQRTARLQNGDALCFGRSLTFRVQLQERPPQPVARLVSLTLCPVDGGKGLQPIVVTQFPFLISKADAAFARYRPEHPHQVDYLSRRHAHVFLKRGMPFVEDLGSTNGTFVGGKRLEEHAVPLAENDTLGFGGDFFVYQVSLQNEELQADPTLTQYAGMTTVGDAAAVKTGSGVAPADRRVDIEKTTFIGAPDSFLDIFCVDQAPTANAGPEEAAGKVAPAGTDGNPAESTIAGKAGTVGGTPRRQSQFRLVASQLLRNLSANDRKRVRRVAWAGAAAAALVLAVPLALYFGGAREREIRDLMVAGDHARAVVAASQYLRSRPDNPEIRALATEALLKAYLPQWMAAVKAQDFNRADAVLAAMRTAGNGIPDARSFLRELGWIDALERFVAGGSGGERPIRIYADEERISALLAQWDEDPLGHQRAAASMSAQVPAFGEVYASALSRLRRLQSDNAVYLTAIERLKSAIATELQHDRPEAIEPLLKTYAEKYPRLTGMDPIHQDLQRYLALHRAIRAGRLGPLVTQQEQTRFATPAFQAQLAALGGNGRLPPAEIVEQYQAIRTAWRRGDTAKAITALASLSTGPWAPAAASERAHKQAIVARAAALEQTRGAPDHAERLVGLYEMLEPEDDVFFIRAVRADPAFDRPRVMRRVQEHMSRAGALWQQYRQAGGIDEAARIEDGMPEAFRSNAQLLAQARIESEQMLRLQRLANAETLQPARYLAQEIAAEADLQRNALLGARTILSPDVLKAKLDLLDAAVPELPSAQATAAQPASKTRRDGNGRPPPRSSVPAGAGDARPGEPP